LAFVEFLRLIVDGAISPEDAVRAYHGVLERLGIKPQRKLDDDLVLQTSVMSYGGGSTVVVPARMPTTLHKAATAGRGPASKPTAQAAGKCDCGCKDKPTETSVSANGQPDFAHMTQAEKLAYNQARRDRIFG
jgi:hypothetical protein